LLPKNTSSLILDNIDELQLHFLPAFSHGELVTEHDLNRVCQAINILEHRLNLELTNFTLMKRGQMMTAKYINQFVSPIDRIREKLDLKPSWDFHPIRPPQMYKVEHMNELYGKVNEAIRELTRRDRD